MRKVPDCNLSLLIDVCEKWPLIVDPEVEDTVLIGECKRRRVNCGIWRFNYGIKVEAVEGRKHGEFEL